MTTTKHVLEIYWDFSSPFAYLGSTQAEALAKKHGATLVFRAIGQADVPMATWSDAKRMYTLKDMTRWAEHWGVPFNFPSSFPTNSLKAMRVYLALPEDRQGAFRERTFRGYWAEDKNIADDAVLKALVGDDGEAVLARTQDPGVKKALIDATEAAVKAGVFGAPTWVVDGKELFWGQDRLPLVERALSR